ncbi:hypothetical protein ON010_g12537 [Phytophthora cinnamomi]|nr:hypothetical protein ON010_g12537 [Phytophthora cinnamomi]
MFDLLFGWWIHGIAHFIGVNALYAVGGRLQRMRLALSPMDAEAHIELFRNVLAAYNNTVNIVQFIVVDNYNTNRSITTKLGVPLVGCASHRFNLAAKKFLTEHEPLLQKANSLMSQLHQPNNAVELRKLTPLRAEKRNAKRWSSTYAMLERYVDLRSHTQLVEAVTSLPSAS